MAKQLKNLRIDEVSSVDRGAGEGVHVVLMKREFSTAERESAADSGAAMPDGSFPIKNKEDLKNAIQAIGRAKNPAAAKAHIKTRARALGATDALPDSWEKADRALAECTTEILESDLDETAKRNALVDLVKQYDDFLKETETMTITVDKADLVALINKSVTDALTAAGVLVTKMTEDHAAFHAKLDGDEKKKFAAMGHEERSSYMKEHPIPEDEHESEGEEGAGEKDEADEAKKLAAIYPALKPPVLKVMAQAIVKAKKEKSKKEKTEQHDGGGERSDSGEGVEAREKRDVELKKRDDQITKLVAQVAALTDKDQRVEFGKRAVELGLQETDGEMLLKAHRGDPEALKKMEQKIQALNAQIAKGELFGEFGKSGGGAGTTAHDQIVAIATELRKADPKLTIEQAYAKALTDPAHAELAKLEKIERNRAINGRA